MSEFQTPFTDAHAAPDLSGSGVSQRGGYDLGEGSQKETPNSLSGLPTQPDLYQIGPGDPGAGAQVPVPVTLDPGRTIHNR